MCRAVGERFEDGLAEIDEVHDDVVCSQPSCCASQDFGDGCWVGTTRHAQGSAEIDGEHTATLLQMTPDDSG